MLTFQPHAYPNPGAPVVDDYFGHRVSDPYRWLENLTSEQTGNWLEAQQNSTQAYFKEAGPAATHQALYKRLTALWHYPKYSVVAKEGPYYFFWGQNLTAQNSHNQATLYSQTELCGEKKVVLDLNQLDPTGYTSVASQAFSRNGQLMAYTLATHGSDWQTLKIRNTLTLSDFPENLAGIKLASVAWKGDNSGFYYNGFWPLKTDDMNQQYSCVFWHALGSPQSEDTLVYRCPQPATTLSVYPQISDDGEYLILTLMAGATPTNRIYYRPVNDSGAFKPLLDANEAGYIFLGNRKSVFYFQTNEGAPRGKVIALDLLDPDPAHWHLIVEEKTAVLDYGLIVAERLVLIYLERASHTLRFYNLDGTFEKEPSLPLAGSISGLSGHYDQSSLFLCLENYHCPPQIYHYSFERGTFDPVFQPPSACPTKNFETHQLCYPGLDKTPITLSLVHQTGLVLDGTNPTILYGYGGFGQNMTPFYWLSQQVWLEQGGVLAVAHIRGGGENGQAWHEAGRRARRQSAIDDFCQAARFLCEAGYTNPSRLAMWGASNGGLLVAACLTQHPELFGAAICQSPLTDMLRYQHFGPGQSWVGEFGSATASREEFEWLYTYSPLHNIRKQSYPATLVMVALGDERVHPLHGLKFAAALQTENQGDGPVLLRIDPTNGHGLDKPEELLIAETTDLWSFLFENLKVELKLPALGLVNRAQTDQVGLPKG